MLDMSRTQVKTYMHQHDTAVPAKKVFTQSVGSPTGGFLTLVFVVTLVTITTIRLNNMLQGIYDSVNYNVKKIEQISKEEIEGMINITVEVGEFGSKYFEKYGLLYENGTWNQRGLDDYFEAVWVRRDQVDGHGKHYTTSKFTLCDKYKGKKITSVVHLCASNWMPKPRDLEILQKSDGKNYLFIATLSCNTTSCRNSSMYQDLMYDITFRILGTDGRYTQSHNTDLLKLGKNHNTRKVTTNIDWFIEQNSTS